MKLLLTGFLAGAVVAIVWGRGGHALADALAPIGQLMRAVWGY